MAPPSTSDESTAAAQAHFQKIPWCARLLSDDRYTQQRTDSRTPKDDTEDSFVAETLRTKQTVPHWLSLARRPADDSPTAQFSEVRILLALGSGVNGHANVAHGGFVASLLDEAFGVLLTLNRQRRERWKAGDARPENGEFTLYLNTTYKAAMPTPSAVVAVAEVVKFDGRKTLVKGDIRGGDGTVYATGEALFIIAKSKL